MRESRDAVGTSFITDTGERGNRVCPDFFRISVVQSFAPSAGSLAIVWAVAKFRPYLMSMPFEVYTDHYALQWLKTMRTGSALLHRWSAALEEYDFTVIHRPGKSQTHVDGLSRLPVDPPPPEDTLLQVRLLEDEDEARKIASELHTATHLGSHALWKFF